ncbi:hypothetical protein VTH82DRAFT_6612 [Thermothelomyces myriococcoides]
MGLVQHANILATIAPYSRGNADTIFIWFVSPVFLPGYSRNLARSSNTPQHCILEWIKQDSAKGQCPMCRQRFEWIEQPVGTSNNTSRTPAV